MAGTAAFFHLFFGQISVSFVVLVNLLNYTQTSVFVCEEKHFLDSSGTVSYLSTKDSLEGLGNLYKHV